MLPYFIAKTSARRSDLTTVDGAFALERYPVLRDAIVDRVGRAAAALFAEPILSRKDDEIEIAWYTEHAGDPAALFSLDTEARKSIGDKLRNRLAALEPLLADPIVGPLLSRALYVADRGGLYAIGQEPVLVGWGIALNWASATRKTLTEQFAATLGPYSPFPAPAVGEETVKSAAPLALAAPAATASLRPSAPRNVGLFVATGLAALAALLLSLPGVLRVLPPAAEQNGDDLSALREITKAMADKVEQARAALAGADCEPSGALAPKPNDNHADPLPPPPIPVKPADGAMQGDMALVAERAAQSVVFVFICKDRAGWDEDHKDDKDKSEPIACPDSDGSANLFLAQSGSGFFVGPKTVVTNMHVVKGAKAVFVTSQFLKKVQPARVLAASVKTHVDDPDFAALGLDVATPPPPIALTTTVARLQNVVSAGFPGVIIDQDPQMERLVRGDPQAAPELTTFPGFVTLTMRPQSDLPLIFSSATIGHGNSGGPLLDLCARAVGINTLGWSGEQEDTGYKVNVAEGAKGLMAFLDANHIAYQASSDACGAAPAPAGGAPPPAPGPSTTPTPTPSMAPIAPPAGK